MGGRISVYRTLSLETQCTASVIFSVADNAANININYHYILHSPNGWLLEYTQNTISWITTYLWSFLQYGIHFHSYRPWSIVKFTGTLFYWMSWELSVYLSPCSMKTSPAFMHFHKWMHTSHLLAGSPSNQIKWYRDKEYFPSFHNHRNFACKISLLS